MVAETASQKGNIAEVEKQSAAAAKASKAKHWETCIAATTAALEHSPNSLDLRELRAGCQLGHGHLEEAAGDLSRAASLAPSIQRIMLRLARLSYFYLGQDGAQALQPVKQCLHFDPDSKPCKQLFRQLKALEKDRAKARNFIESSAWRAAATILAGKDGLAARLRDALKDDADLDLSATQSQTLTAMLEWTCRAQVRAGDIRAAATVCEDLLSRNPDNIDGLVGRGEEALRKDDFEAANRALSDAFEKGGRSDRDVLERLQRAQKLLKRSKVKVRRARERSLSVCSCTVRRTITRSLAYRAMPTIGRSRRPTDEPR
jgi:DnaJ family protein C protein 3